MIPFYILCKDSWEIVCSCERCWHSTTVNLFCSISLLTIYSTYQKVNELQKILLTQQTYTDCKCFLLELLLSRNCGPVESELMCIVCLLQVLFPFWGNCAKLKKNKTTNSATVVLLPPKFRGKPDHSLKLSHVDTIAVISLLGNIPESQIFIWKRLHSTYVVHDH